MTNMPPKIALYETPDGSRLAYRLHAAADERRGVVVLLHGIISHSGWYEAIGNYLAERGLEVFALDRRGSGLNTNGRGDVDQWRTWLADVVSFIESHREDKPVVLLGISWGGKLAPVVARERPDLLAAFGMLCPGIYARQQPSVAKRTALHTTGPLGVHEKRVTIPLQDPTLFTDSPPWQSYIHDDPLTLREITVRFAREDHALTRYARNSPPFIHTPALLALAGQDRIVDNRRTEKYFHNLASPDKTLLEYHTAAHTLEFEPDPERYFDDVANWVERVVRRGRG